MGKKQLVISVIIPAYNEEKNLAKCLSALTNQEYPKDSYEIIVSDNNSTDKTADIAKSFGAKVVTAEKQGYVHAVEQGFSKASGKIIACTDADTVVGTNWLSDIENVFKNSDNVAAMTGSVESDFNPVLFRRVVDYLYSLLLRFTFLIGNPNIAGYNMAFRKELYDEIGGVNTDYEIGADVEIGRRLMKKGKVIFVPNIKVKTSARRWKNDFYGTLIKYVRSYIYVHYFKKSIQDNLPVYR